jgi:hypothetical protein
MTSEDHDVEPAGPDEAQSALSRRGLLRSAAGLGIAGATAGLLINATAGSASAAQASTTAPDGRPLPANAGPLVAHVHDARTGEVDLFAGEQHVRVHNPALAHALANAATSGH